MQAVITSSKDNKLLKFRILFTMLFAFFIAFTVLQTNSITAYATSGNGTGANDGTNLRSNAGQGYPSASKTGWLVYLADSSGQLRSEVAFVSGGGTIPGTEFNDAYLTTRIGNAYVSPGRWNKNAEWGPPLISGNGRGAVVKQELISSNSYNGVDLNGYYVVKKYLGDDALNTFKSDPDNMYLILETCAWHKLFHGNFTGNYVVVSSSGVPRLEADGGVPLTSDGSSGWMDNARLQICAQLEADWPGLPPAPGAVTAGISATNRMGYDQIDIYGTGMIAIKGTEVGNSYGATHTWDSSTYPHIEGKPPTPPASETDPTKLVYTIIKSYRLRSNGNLTPKGTFVRTSTVASIIIEDEPLNDTDKNYIVIGWAQSSTRYDSINPLTWENDVPQVKGETGREKGSTTLDAQHKILYVLLEAEINGGSGNTNYILPESSITRQIDYSLPDDANTNMGTTINAYKFSFLDPAHTTTCGGHDWNHGTTWQTSVPSGCSDYDSKEVTDSYDEYANVCNDGKHANDDPKCKNYTYKKVKSGSKHTEYKCKGHSWTCTDFTWEDQDLQFDIENTNKESSPSILASKWSFEIPVGVSSLSDAQVSMKRTETNQWLFMQRFNAYGVIMRGDDKLTIAAWKTNDVAGTTKSLCLTNGTASSITFNHANTPITGGRKTSDYQKFFTSVFEPRYADRETTFKATNYTGEMSSDGSLCSSTVKLSSTSSFTYSNVGVDVEVYSGQPTLTPTGVDNFDNIVIKEGNTIKSGSAVPSGTITFYPYIQMKYDTNTKGDKNNTAYVLGQYQRSIAFNSYAGVEWTRVTTNPNITLESTQWSTHNEANKNHEPGTVLPGGATLTLTIKNADRQKIKVITYQPILMGAGEAQVNATGTNGLKDLNAAEIDHKQFVDSVIANLNNLELQQYFTDQDNRNESRKDDILQENSSKPVSSNVTITKPHSGESLTTSDESKYYFNKYNTSSGEWDKHDSLIDGNKGDLDVEARNTTATYYLFWADTQGNIRMAKDTSYNAIVNIPAGSPNVGKVVWQRSEYSSDGEIVLAEAYEINRQTGVINKLMDALERGTGNDFTATWVSDGRWYNEAMDGITYVRHETIVEAGFATPNFRTTIIDPKLTPKSDSKGNIFSNFNTIQFKMKSQIYKDTAEFWIATFIDSANPYETAEIHMQDMDMLFWSREIYIPDVTVQDLY